MIDISELHIGSHVLFNGERVEVVGINISKDLGFSHVVVRMERLDDPIPNITTQNVKADNIDPIPITDELLAEFGFEPYYDEGIDVWRKTYNADHSDIKRGYGTIRAYRCSDGWVVDTYPAIFGCDYLHEAEAFVYLTTKQRLL